jgi:hypothetical protein
MKARKDCMRCSTHPRPGAVEIVTLDSEEQGNDEEWQEAEFESESESQVPIRRPESV